MPPQPPKKRRPWLWLIPLVVVVVAAAITVPILLSGGSPSAQSGQNGPSPSPAKPLQSWQVSAQKLGAYTEGLGVRVYGGDLLMVTDSAVTAFDRATGRQDWVLTPPQGNNFCALSRNIANDRLALGFGASDDRTGVHCLSIGLVDLKAHSFAWSVPVPQFKTDWGDPSGQGLVLAGGYLYAGGLEVFVRLSLSDGTIEPLAPTAAFQAGHDDDCSVMDVGADATTVYTVSRCLGTGASYSLVLGLDPGTGNVRVSNRIQAADVKMPMDASSRTGLSDAQFVSLSPTVLALYGKGQQALARLDDSLKVSWASVVQQGAIDFGGDTGALPNGNHQFNRAFVSDGLLFGVSASEKTKENQVVALDVNSGRQRWAATVPGDSMCDPVGVDGNALLVAGSQLQTGGINNPATVLAKIDVGSGKVLSAKPQSNPVEGAASGVTLPANEVMAYLAWVVADGRVYGGFQHKVLLPGDPVVFSLG
ncbi:PQQ-binding-like beta-propeller repeat protein [Amycolatopsis rhizosphaerae]|uniref:PQQ-binding-like beta-propeller repeat protein n=1 Tax=Amycolatopsis rhizosphaerae TaxID=2053003 RepID=A0A558D6I2_9PSEU|nr:PQQ-binding-like beta-propeller repeat protein [Amycolatopsis rhizosphaerae]TVT56616.1 PQQ-binding-like beta-propeller repeat protein [Amycolatopsis rhizosphaerae]